MACSSTAEEKYEEACKALATAPEASGRASAWIQSCCGSFSWDFLCLIATGSNSGLSGVLKSSGFGHFMDFFQELTNIIVGEFSENIKIKL